MYNENQTTQTIRETDGQLTELPEGLKTLKTTVKRGAAALSPAPLTPSAGLKAPPEESRLQDTVLPTLARWQAAGQKAVLVTLTSYEGTSPRPVGAEMAVSETGEITGHIATDCLGDAIRQEAQTVLSTGHNRLIRFGKGSPYMDLKLPCGSGIDLYFDGHIHADESAAMARLLTTRQPFTHSRRIISQEEAPPATTRHQGNSGKITQHQGAVRTGWDEAEPTLFHRSYLPAPQLILAGSGPALVELARLAKEAGCPSHILSNDETVSPALDALGLAATPLHQAARLIEQTADPFTACALLFHDHEKELSLIPAMLKVAPFYIGAMGSRRAHDLRLSALEAAGMTKDDTARISGPAGLIPAAKNPALLAISIWAEILHTAQSKSLL